MKTNQHFQLSERINLPPAMQQAYFEEQASPQHGTNSIIHFEHGCKWVIWGILDLGIKENLIGLSFSAFIFIHFIVQPIIVTKSNFSNTGNTGNCSYFLFNSTKKLKILYYNPFAMYQQ